MPDNTMLQFGGTSSVSPPEAAASPTPIKETPRGRVCPSCAHVFSSSAQFCPFDGQPLELAPNWDPSGDALIGRVIDERYEFLARIGEGGMGAVYRVRHVKLEREFAIKVLKHDLAGEAGLAERFIREARAAAAISHPNVVQITDFGTVDDQPYFVMELLQGHSLASLIKRGGSIPARRAVRILRAVADALGAAHAAGVVHRDLKPDNIHVGDDLVGGHDSVKVLDFGLAKVAGGSKLTRRGMVFGTPHYMSPEQASGDPVDLRADVYALGVVMYEMFTGKVPFEADTYMGVLTKHMYVQPTPPSQVIEKARELGALEDITLRCLEKKPAARFASMAEFLEALEDVVQVDAEGEMNLRPSAPGPERPRSLLADDLEPPGASELRLPKSRLSPGALAGVVGAGVLFVASLAWLLLRSPSQEPQADRERPIASKGAGSQVSGGPGSAAASAASREEVADTAPATTAETEPAPTSSAPAAPVAVPRPVAPRAVPPPPTSQKKRKFRSNDIVDPWGN